MTFTRPRGRLGHQLRGRSLWRVRNAKAFGDPPFDAALQIPAHIVQPHANQRAHGGIDIRRVRRHQEDGRVSAAPPTRPRSTGGRARRYRTRRGCARAKGELIAQVDDDVSRCRPGCEVASPDGRGCPGQCRQQIGAARVHLLHPLVVRRKWGTCPRISATKASRDRPAREYRVRDPLEAERRHGPRAQARAAHRARAMRRMHLHAVRQRRQHTMNAVVELIGEPTFASSPMRSGRPSDPTNRKSPDSRICGVVGARARSNPRNDRCSGVWPGV